MVQHTCIGMSTGSRLQSGQVWIAYFELGCKFVAHNHPLFTPRMMLGYRVVQPFYRPLAFL